MDTLHNKPPSDAELFQERIDDLKARMLSASESGVTEANAGEVRDMIGLAGALAKEIEAKRKAEKQPVLDQGKAIDATYNPLKQAAERAADPLKAKLQAFLKEKQRKADEARREAQQKAEEEARAAAALRDDPLLGDAAQADAKAAEQEARLVEAEAKAKSTVKGSEGFRAATIRKTFKGEITDEAALVLHYARNPDVITAALKCANADIRAMKGQINIPGVKVITEETLV